jgi:hypothetical protein
MEPGLDHGLLGDPPTAFPFSLEALRQLQDLSTASSMNDSTSDAHGLPPLAL